MESPDDPEYSVDARAAEGVLVGDGSTQINYFYNRTWTGGPISPPPLVGVSGDVESPYRGLSAFGERDAGFFFGRETAATEVLDRMDEHLTGARPMVLSGVSGAGKSSLLRAGVLPRLRGAGLASAREAASWPCLVFTPTRTPLAELAVRIAPVAGADAATIRRGLAADPAAFGLTARQAALAKTSGPRPAEGRRRVLLIVDQFEQLFTQCADEEERRAFVTALHAAATGAEPGALVVLVVRADFEARCADHPDLTAAVQDRYLVTAMTERQMRMAITRPAVTAGSGVDADLVEVLVDEAHSRLSERGVPDGTGVLPLLSHALDQAWRSREGTVLSLADYERTGGIEGAVADSAQRAYGRLTPSQQAVAQQVFIRLTATTPSGVDTANRVDRTELTHGRGDAEVRDVAAVLEAFAAERLLILAADTVEISHEVLLTAWPLLRDEWLGETHADRLVLTRLRTTAAEWERRSRDPSYLYSGSLLHDATTAADRITADPARRVPLNTTEREFIEAGDRAQRRNRRKRQGFVASLGALAVIFAAIAAMAVRADREAVEQRDIAIADKVSVESETLGDTDPTISALKSVAAWRIKHTAQAEYGMRAAAARPGIAVLPHLGGSDGVVLSVAFSPDGRILATGGDRADGGEEGETEGQEGEEEGQTEGAVRLWDATTHRPIGAPIDSAAQVTSLAFSPDGRTLAYRSTDGVVRFLDVTTRRATGAELRTDSDESTRNRAEKRPATFGSSLSYSRDGRFLVTGSAFGTVRLWNAATRRPLGAPLSGLADPAGHAAFSPDGRTLAAGDTAGRVRIWETATRRPHGGFDTGSPIQSLAFNRDGTLATANESAVRLWNVTDGRPIATFGTDPATTPLSVAFNADGTVLASGGFDNTVRLWNVATRRQLGAPFASVTDPVDSLAFSPDGTLAGAGGDGTARLWDTSTSPIGSSFPASIFSSAAMAFTADDSAMAVANLTGPVRLWSTVTRHEIGALPSGHSDQIVSVAFTGDGRTAAIGGNGGTLQLWDMATRHLTADLTDRTAGRGSFSMAFSHDGRTLAVGDEKGRVSLWNVTTHRRTRDLIAGSGLVRSVAFSPDGRTLATANGGTVRLWDTTAHHRSGGAFRSAGNDIAFVRGGKTLLTRDDPVGTVRSWNTATHRLIGRFSTTSAGPMAVSPDGELLAASGAHGGVQLWDIATGRPIGGPLTGPTLNVASLSFSHDGKALAAGGEAEGGSPDDKVWTWKTDYLLNVRQRLCARAGRSLTRAEWQREIPSGPAYRAVCARSR